MATQQSRPRRKLNISLFTNRSMGVLVLSPDFVKPFRLFHFRRKEMESQEALKKNKAYVQTIMSMPGIGMITSLAIKANSISHSLWVVR
ncbi:hypothetical protein LEP1GSC115_5019 [Leptospira interrogans serovar Australis str. 200703203]|uniref:Uncharacterized protein n=3 Tax=Leptospira interrogans TaxID=173 RepID=N1UN69_LEPIR|nr:hypothetical protein LEP1GSC115_5019 [Leptospira interrogans serovar Australis str. 200703203]